jgi:hypothetical protein
LYYYNARWYDPSLGRFTQADKLIFDFFNPLAFEKYSYGLNNPINVADPSGNKPTDCENIDPTGNCEPEEEDDKCDKFGSAFSLGCTINEPGNITNIENRRQLIHGYMGPPQIAESYDDFGISAILPAGIFPAVMPMWLNLIEISYPFIKDLKPEPYENPGNLPPNVAMWVYYTTSSKGTKLSGIDIMNHSENYVSIAKLFMSVPGSKSVVAGFGGRLHNVAPGYSESWPLYQQDPIIYSNPNTTVGLGVPIGTQEKLEYRDWFTFVLITSP